MGNRLQLTTTLSKESYEKLAFLAYYHHTSFGQEIDRLLYDVKIPSREEMDKIMSRSETESS